MHFYALGTAVSVWRPATVIGGTPALGFAIEVTICARYRFKWLLSAERWPKKKKREAMPTAL